MEEQDDSKKQARAKPTKEELDNFARRMKRPTNGPIPAVVRNSDGHMYIVREFKEEMRGKKIPDDMVVRAKNGRWFTKNEVENFVMKSTPRCPTYGVCAHCFGSGPVHMMCQKCRNKDEIYMIPKRNGKFIDVEWISRFFGTSHLDVRADRTQNWPTQRIWALTKIQLQVNMMCRWPPGVRLKKEHPTLWAVYLELLDDGIRTENAGPWDSWDNPVEILRWDDPLNVLWR
jgi:hypothetical protein